MDYLIAQCVCELDIVTGKVDDRSNFEFFKKQHGKIRRHFQISY